MTAILSDCGTYRYLLTREVGPASGTVGFLMLNPSTADATLDDPTIRKCIGFVKRFGHGRLEVANLFAFRATDPKELRKVSDPVGPDNDRHLREFYERCDFVVCAWGANGSLKQRDAEVCRLLGGTKFFALALTKSRAPGHPLYLPYELEPLPWGGA